MSLKAKIRNYAKDNNIAAQVILQNYMFERFLERLSHSYYKEKFIVKGGMLIAAIVGIDTRATMDLDASLRELTLTEESVRDTIENIVGIKLTDNVEFKLISISEIRKDDVYGGYTVRIDAHFDNIVTPLSIDISTGDIITPAPIHYNFIGMFDEQVEIELLGYNIETVLAEKVETILSRGVLTSRPRDFYDVYILVKTQKIDKVLFKEALKGTTIHRGTDKILDNTDSILDRLKNSEILMELWRKYQKQFKYASDITYDETLNALIYLIK